jgi:hypothetical protein
MLGFFISSNGFSVRQKFKNFQELTGTIIYNIMKSFNFIRPKKPPIKLNDSKTQAFAWVFCFFVKK